MYVQCERCQTEYDFDDALVSERGTTVKCTSCGHQFRVRRSMGAPEEDRWVISTAQGSTLIFTSLRELQRAISGNAVGRDDVLARGSAPPRQLGAIAELEPFFHGREPERRVTAPIETADAGPLAAADEAHLPVVSGVPRGTLAGTGRAGEDHFDPPTLPPTEAPNPPLPPEAGARASAAVEPTGPGRAVWKSTRIGVGSGHRSTTQVGIGQVGMGQIGMASPEAGQVDNAAQEPRPGAVTTQGVGPEGALAPTVRVPAVTNELAASPSASPSPVPPAYGTYDSRAGRSGPASGAWGERPIDPAQKMPERRFPTPTPSLEGSLPPPTAPVRRAESLDEEDFSDGRRRRSRTPLSAMVEPLPRRNRAARWFVAIVMLFGVGAIAAVFGRPYLDRISKSIALPEAEPAPDPRLGTYLKQGETALDQGNLDQAKDNFDKASALADKDPRVLIDVARLAAVRADVPWLRQRLLPDDPRAENEARANKTELDALVNAALKSADAAMAAAPNEMAAKKVKVDALRLAGEKESARALVGSASLNASQPDAAYTLAALDLSEQDPPFAIVIERLRTAAGGEGTLGRARAALVYALARSGDAALSKQELDRLAALPRPHPLLASLRAYVERGGTGVDAGAAASAAQDAGAASAASSVSAAPKGKGAAHAAAPPPAPNELQQADSAKNHNDLPRAKALYQGVLAKNPHNVEALTGMGDVARGQRDLQGAQGYYKRAIADNSAYMPALVGLGDVQWEMGDRAGATRTYKDIVERMPEGTYPHRVKQRVESTSGPSPSPEQ
ncbi:zinc-ribbon domain-containing protein [Pendulispora rubella]|uniref:Zinc-ribbon domain-containing protein n=1 Tax=Pendulispora rubella TaxID=2741070 RepID=A0ABZ2LGH1_9BACT